jgi:dipeptidyl aminopeptidase/acylaminoacyl peptidase
VWRTITIAVAAGLAAGCAQGPMRSSGIDASALGAAADHVYTIDEGAAGRWSITGVAPTLPTMVPAAAPPGPAAQGYRTVQWHPSSRQMLVLYGADGGQPERLGVISADGGDIRPLGPQQAERVSWAGWDPVHARYAVVQLSAPRPAEADPATSSARFVQIDVQSGEAAHWHRVPPTARPQAALKGTGAWLFIEAPQAGAADDTLWAFDADRPAAPGTQLARLPGAGWSVQAQTADGRRLVLVRTGIEGAAISDLGLLQLPARVLGQPRTPALPSWQTLPSVSAAPGDGQGRVRAVLGIERGGGGLWVATEGQTGAQRIERYDLQRQRWRVLTTLDSGQILSGALSDDGHYLAVQTFDRERSRILVWDTRGGRTPMMPAVDAAWVGVPMWRPATNELAFDAEGRRLQPTVFWLDRPEAGARAFMPAARLAAPAAIDSATVEHRIVRRPLADGRLRQAVLTMPDAKSAAPAPLLIVLRGSLRDEVSAGPAPDLEPLVQSLGFAVLQQRPPAVRAAGAADELAVWLDWAAAQPDIDARRIFIAGGGRAGQLALAAAAAHPGRLAGALALGGCPAAAGAQAELDAAAGGASGPADERGLPAASAPAAPAQTTPLLLIHGANDSLCPRAAAVAFARAARARHQPVWHVVAEHEPAAFEQPQSQQRRQAWLTHFLQTFSRPAGPAVARNAAPLAAAPPAAAVASRGRCLARPMTTAGCQSPCGRTGCRPGGRRLQLPRKHRMQVAAAQ